jgi:hypothetical protein
MKKLHRAATASDLPAVPGGRMDAPDGWREFDCESTFDNQ